MRIRWQHWAGRSRRAARLMISPVAPPGRKAVTQEVDQDADDTVSPRRVTTRHHNKHVLYSVMDPTWMPHTPRPGLQGQPHLAEAAAPWHREIWWWWWCWCWQRRWDDDDDPMLVASERKNDCYVGTMMITLSRWRSHCQETLTDSVKVREIMLPVSWWRCWPRLRWWWCSGHRDEDVDDERPYNR